VVLYLSGGGFGIEVIVAGGSSVELLVVVVVVELGGLSSISFFVDPRPSWHGIL